MASRDNNICSPPADICLENRYKAPYRRQEQTSELAMIDQQIHTSASNRMYHVMEMW